MGRVYRIKGYELPEGGRDAKGQHIANLLAFQPGETIASVISIKDYEAADYLVLATESGLVKKTKLADYDSARTGGLIAIKLRELEDGSVDQVVSARLANEGDDILLVSRKGMSLRFTATDEALRPMGRPSSGVRGMKFRDDDRLLTMDVVREDADVFIVTEKGFAKRTPVSEYRPQGRGGYGIKVAKITAERGDLVGALISSGEDVLVIMASGKVMRSSTSEVSATGRNTQGVTFAKPDRGDAIIAIALNTETQMEEEVDEADDSAKAETKADVDGTASSDGGTGTEQSSDEVVSTEEADTDSAH